MDDSIKAVDPAFPQVENLPSGYDYLSKLGEGAHGVVYKARSVSLDRIVAVKILKTESSAEVDKQIVRMKREAQTLARLEHPNIVRLFQVGVNNAGTPFLVCEFLEGSTLQTILLRGEKLTHEKIHAIFQQVISALQHAHENQIVHRDIKPSNIMISEDAGALTVKILDFGIARETEVKDETSNHGLTRTSLLSGSPAYMSPEQCRGEFPKAASDFYSCACVIYECLFGQPPFMGESDLSTQYNKVHHSLAHLTPVLSKVSPVVRSFFEKTLSRSPEKRPKDGQEFQSLLSAAFVGASAIPRTKFNGVPILIGLLVIVVLAFVFTSSKKPSEVKLGTKHGIELKPLSLEAKLCQFLRDCKETQYMKLSENERREIFNRRDQVYGELKSSPLDESNRGIKFFAAVLRARLIDSATSADEMEKSIAEARALIPKAADGKPYFDEIYCEIAEIKLLGKRNRLRDQKALIEKVLKVRESSEEDPSKFNYLQIPHSFEPILHDINKSVDLYYDAAENAFLMKDWARCLSYLEKEIPLVTDEGRYSSGAASLYEMKAQVLVNTGHKDEAEKFALLAVDTFLQDNLQSRARRILQEQALLRLAKWFYLQGDKKDCIRTMKKLKAVIQIHSDSENIVSTTDVVLGELTMGKEVGMWKGKSVNPDFLFGW